MSRVDPIQTNWLRYRPSGLIFDKLARSTAPELVTALPRSVDANGYLDRLQAYCAHFHSGDVFKYQDLPPVSTRTLDPHTYGTTAFDPRYKESHTEGERSVVVKTRKKQKPGICM